MELDQYFDRVYNNYRRYALIPVALWLLALGVLGYGWITADDSGMFRKGVEFSSGTEIQVRMDSRPDILQVERTFADAGFPDARASIGEPDADNPLLLVKLKGEIEDKKAAADIIAGSDTGMAGEPDSIQLTTYSQSVSQSFFTQAMIAVVLAFTTMSVVIFAAFRDTTPSIAVIFAAAGDIIFSLAAMYVLGIPLTLGTIAALLMLIGYSVDTDIVLSSRVLKRTRGSLRERILSSVLTGSTMSIGGVAVFSILYIVSINLIGAPSLLTETSSVMIIGLLVDMPFTWFGNAFILKKYAEEDWKPVETVFSRARGVTPWT